jgi:hypothetical protein
VQEYNQDYIYLYRKTENYSYFNFIREYEGIINKAIRLFGVDYNNKNEFDWDIEIQEINEGKWKGRFWDFGNLTVLIEINFNIETNDLGLLITPKKNNENPH